MPYEPYASFPYAVRWPYSAEQWQALHDLDRGATLRDWHIGSIARLEPDLREEDRTAIDAHRKRGYGRLPYPIDDPPAVVDLNALLGRL